MRIKIKLKGKQNLKIPFNYNHIISAIIYNKILDLNLANKLHSSTSFKFFNFSQIYVPKRKIVKDGLISKNGIICFYISSPNNNLMKNFINGFINDTNVKFKNEKLNVIEINEINSPEFSKKSEFRTISPIIIKSKKEIGGKLKEWDLAPSDQFFRGIENNLIKKYCKFQGIDKTNKKIHAYSEMANVKRKRIILGQKSNITHHRSYMMDIILEGDIELIKFAYSAGLGSKNSMGFGMLKKC